MKRREEWKEARKGICGLQTNYRTSSMLYSACVVCHTNHRRASASSIYQPPQRTLHHQTNTMMMRPLGGRAIAQGVHGFTFEIRFIYFIIVINIDAKWASSKINFNDTEVINLSAHRNYCSKICLITVTHFFANFFAFWFLDLGIRGKCWQYIN